MQAGPEFSPAPLLDFLAQVLSLEQEIVGKFGNKWSPLFRSIRTRTNRIRFSDEEADAAFTIDPKNGSFTFYTAGFNSLRSAVVKLAGSDAQDLGLLEIADAAYALHELYHPPQGLNRFEIVQDHKKVPSGLDDIGKLDHAADIHAITLIAAVLVLRSDEVDRVAYLKKLREVLFLMNRAAPIAFGIPDDAFHKQKRRLKNWFVFTRIDDALNANMVAEIEEQVAPLDTPLWANYNLKTGDVVLWQQEPMHRVIGTARFQPSILRRALRYRENLDRGELMPVRGMLDGLQISARAIIAKQAVESPSSLM